MDYLQAHRPSGHLHASTLDHPRGYGEVFERVMQRQGCTVTRMSLADARARPVQAAPAPRAVTSPALPDVGQEIVTPRLGRCTVAYLVTMPWGRVPVARGPRGEGMVQAGHWTPAPAVVVAAPTEPPAPVVVASRPPLPTVMPSLFEAAL